MPTVPLVGGAQVSAGRADLALNRTSAQACGASPQHPGRQGDLVALRGVEAQSRDFRVPIRTSAASLAHRRALVTIAKGPVDATARYMPSGDHGCTTGGTRPMPMRRKRKLPTLFGICGGGTHCAVRDDPVWGRVFDEPDHRSRCCGRRCGDGPVAGRSDRPVRANTAAPNPRDRAPRCRKSGRLLGQFVELLHTTGAVQPAGDEPLSRPAQDARQ